MQSRRRLERREEESFVRRFRTRGKFETDGESIGGAWTQQSHGNSKERKTESKAADLNFSTEDVQENHHGEQRKMREAKFKFTWVEKRESGSRRQGIVAFL